MRSDVESSEEVGVSQGGGSVEGCGGGCVGSGGSGGSGGYATRESYDGGAFGGCDTRGDECAKCGGCVNQVLTRFGPFET